MTWKCALMGLPYGGAKDDVIVDPKRLSIRELERMARRYATEIACSWGRAQYSCAGRVGTNAQVMAWMMDVFDAADHSIPAVITGKPVSIGGTAGRESATSWAWPMWPRAVLKRRLGRRLEDVTVAVQGFSNVGDWTAQHA